MPSDHNEYAENIKCLEQAYPGTIESHHVLELKRQLQEAREEVERVRRDNDRLATLFRIQRVMQEAFPGRWQPWDGKYPMRYPTNFREQLDYWLTCIAQEVAECRDWLPWKTWSQKLGNKIDIKHWSPEHMKEIQVELVDILHFWMNACMVAGLGADEVFAMYLEKNQVNYDRQATGRY